MGTSLQIKVFYHVCATGDGWERIVRDQLAKLLFSGLYHAAAAVYACVSGAHAHDAARLLAEAGRVQVLAVEPADTSHERLTLLRMHEAVQPGDAVLYLHSKGVTKPGDERVWDWRALMEYFVVGHWKSCVDVLVQGADAVGVNYKDAPWRHFSGNFWWCTGAHFLKLPRAIGDDYFAPEAYLLSQGGTAACVMSTAVDHYKERYPPSLYVDASWRPTWARA